MKIRQIASSGYTGMTDVVQPGRFSLFTSSTGLPAPLAPYGYPAPEHFYAILAVASNSSQIPPKIGGVRPKPDQPIYGVNTVRYDQDGSGEPHVNVDRALVFQDERGRAFRLTFKEHPAHYRSLSRDTGLKTVLGIQGIPHRPKGTLSELSSSAGWRIFSTEFPGGSP